MLKESRLLKDLSDGAKLPGFRGLIVFRTREDMRYWLHTNAHHLIRIGGRYKIAHKLWEFPCGSSIMLDHIQNAEEKTKGMVFSFIEIDDQIKNQDTRDKIMMRKRIFI